MLPFVIHQSIALESRATEIEYINIIILGSVSLMSDLSKFRDCIKSSDER